MGASISGTTDPRAALARSGCNRHYHSAIILAVKPTKGKTRAGVALAACVVSARHSANLTQEQLARAVGIGTSTVRQIESGNANGTSITTVLRILLATETPLDALADVYAAASAG